MSVAKGRTRHHRAASSGSSGESSSSGSADPGPAVSWPPPRRHDRTARTGVRCQSGRQGRRRCCMWCPSQETSPKQGENPLRSTRDHQCMRRRDRGAQRMRQACRQFDICLRCIGGFASALDTEGRAKLKLSCHGRDKRSDPTCRSPAADASGNFRHWSDGGPQRTAKFRVDNRQARFNLATAHGLARQKAEVAVSGGAT